MIYKLFHIQTLPWRRNKQVRDAFIHVSTEATIAPIEPIQIWYDATLRYTIHWMKVSHVTDDGDIVFVVKKIRKLGEIFGFTVAFKIWSLVYVSIRSVVVYIVPKFWRFMCYFDIFVV